MIIRSKRIYTHDGLVDGCMEVVDGKIKRIFAGDCDGSRDIGNLRVIPGVFDTHNHGTQGFTLWPDEDGSYEDKLRGYLKGVASEGVTLVFPTLFSALGVGENTLEVISLIAKVADGEIDGAKIGGIHFEGPYLNRVGEKGTRTEPLKIDVDFVKKIIESAGGKLRLMGLAPELPNSDKLIALLVENGVSAAFTHTDCLSEEAFAAFDKGITVATHLCNVMVGIHHRDVGGLGAAILDERVWCELICDGLHVTNNMIKLILRAKPNDHVMMISDCTGYSGAPVGTYNEFLGGSGTVIVDDKGFVREPGGRLRGSSKPVLYGIKNLTENIGLSMEEALKLSSLNPCKKYGYDATKGSLKEGKDADFVIIDDGFNALETFVGGKKVFDRKTEGDKIFNNELLLKINGGK